MHHISYIVDITNCGLTPGGNDNILSFVADNCSPTEQDFDHILLEGNQQVDFVKTSIFFLALVACMTPTVALAIKINRITNGFSSRS
jgi:hypothetical protein